MHPPIDATLPALQIGFDLQMISERLRSLWPPSLRKPLIVTRARLLDHKPGQRALIEYQADIGRRQSCTLLAKLYTDAAQAERVAENTRWLWDHVFRQSRSCSIPQPLGVLRDLAMFVYLPVEGQFLDELIPGPQATRLLARTSTWLATLHRQPLATSKRFRFATELPNLATWANRVVETYPETTEAVSQLVDFLQTGAAHLPFGTETVIHKDFHYGHVIVNGKLHVIDFDEVRLGDPNFDLAHFCVNLQLLAWRKSGDPEHLVYLQRAFLLAYARQTGWVQDQRFGYFFTYTCLKLAWQLCRGSGPPPRPAGEARRTETQMILAQGVAVL